MGSARRPRRAAALALCAAVPLVAGLGKAAFAMDWPLSPPRLAATFGTYAKGRVVLGVALAAEDGLVRSAEDGDLAFGLEEGMGDPALPSPLGSFAVVEHGKGMAAVYAHLAPGSLATYLRKPKAGDILGKPGASGWAEGQGALFQVFDRRAGTWVNPLLVLPPLADDKPPVVRSLALSRADRTYLAGEAAPLPQGTYKISVDVADPADAPRTVGPLAPFGIRLSIDGVESARELFDVARGSGGELLLSSVSPIPAGSFRTKEGRYFLAERLLTRGRTSVEVAVEDAAGNRRSVSWTIVVE